jgi:hypothetical protein
VDVIKRNFIQQYKALNVGYFVFAAIIISVIGFFYPGILFVSAAFYWFAAFRNRFQISKRNQIQTIALAVLGFSLTLIAHFLQPNSDISGLLNSNLTIVSMIGAVSFLTVISRPKLTQEERLPQGNRSIISTFLSVHLFGSVINISSLFIHADRMSANRLLTRAQVVLLTRGFSTAAFWSPFFAAMAVAISYTPQANLFYVMTIGISLSLLSLLITYFEVRSIVDQSVFHGYPLRLASLWLPSLLAIIVFSVHALFEQLSILVIITMSAPLLSILVLCARAKPHVVIKEHIEKKLSGMHNEIALFLSAGIFGFGLKNVVNALQLHAVFQQFDALTASICFFIIMLLSLLGFHMLIGISIMAPLVISLNPDPSLLAVVILCGWSLGSAVGPLSGMNISIQSIYGIKSNTILRWNFKYVCIMSCVVISVLFLFEAYLLQVS